MGHIRCLIRIRTAESLLESALIHPVRDHKGCDPIDGIAKVHPGAWPQPPAVPLPGCVLRSADEHVLTPCLHFIKHDWCSVVGVVTYRAPHRTVLPIRALQPYMYLLPACSCIPVKDKIEVLGIDLTWQVWVDAQVKEILPV